MRVASFVTIALLLSLNSRIRPARGEPDPWESAIDSTTQARFIPVELWTGMDWDGKRELEFLKAESRFGDRLNKEIHGPLEWRHPVTGETLRVYERTNQGKGGVKSQLFAINAERNGLGRVYDARADLGVRSFSGGLKFPLGYWKQGETRQVEEKRYEGARADTRLESITITQLDFNFQNQPHCLEFNWIYRESRKGKIVDQQTYTYCPNRGMVKQVQS